MAPRASWLPGRLWAPLEQAVVAPLEQESAPLEDLVVPWEAVELVAPLDEPAVETETSYLLGFPC